MVFRFKNKSNQHGGIDLVGIKNQKLKAAK
jgi:hypothetical protein